ncbi:MAG: STAS/SEC14 domain-containing protein [Solirubrobacterales bacterium]
MIELIEGLPDGVVGFEAKGEVTGGDYEEVLIPAVKRELQSGEKVRLLYVLGEGFDGYSAAAMWDDTKVGMSHLFSWERIAVVTDHGAYRHLVKGFGFMIPAQVRVFGLDELEQAKAWVAAAD